MELSYPLAHTGSPRWSLLRLANDCWILHLFVVPIFTAAIRQRQQNSVFTALYQPFVQPKARKKDYTALRQWRVDHFYPSTDRWSGKNSLHREEWSPQKHELSKERGRRQLSYEIIRIYHHLCALKGEKRGGRVVRLCTHIFEASAMVAADNQYSSLACNRLQVSAVRALNLGSTSPRLDCDGVSASPCINWPFSKTHSPGSDVGWYDNLHSRYIILIRRPLAVAVASVSLISSHIFVIPFFLFFLIFLFSSHSTDVLTRYIEINQTAIRFADKQTK